MHMIRNTLRWHLVLISVIALTACGFHLRGQVPLPEILRAVYIKSSDVSVEGQLADSIVASGAKVVKDPTQATAVIIVHNVNRGRLVKSVSGQGRVREFKISYSVRFEVRSAAGVVLLKARSIERSRDISFNESEVVGKSVEEGIILGELEREGIQRIKEPQTLNTTSKPPVTPNTK